MGTAWLRIQHRRFPVSSLSTACFGVVNVHLRQIVSNMGLRKYEQTDSI